MKAIMVMFDSLNRHLLPPYGGTWTHMPNFERLARRTVAFDQCYVGSMPCMPARRELHTGRYNFLHRSWGPVEPFDDSMPALLAQNGVYTHLVSDHYHYWEDGGATYHNRYSSWDGVRGQEGDHWIGQVAPPQIPPTLSTRDSSIWKHDWINRAFMPREEDQPQPQTFARGLDFIRRNAAQDNWFLQIETFDPHEPFFTQQHYKDLYPHDYDGPHFDWPNYDRVRETPEQVQHMRYEYAALLSMCDYHLGQVLDLMDTLRLWDDTLLIVCTDHGFLLGEHDWWAKIVMPFYQEIAHTPLFIWDPRSGRQNARCDSLVQMIDFPATLLEFFGVDRPEHMMGLPLRDAVAHGAPVHEAVLFGVHGGHVNVTDGRTVYMRAPATPDNTPLFNYTVMPTHMDKPFQLDELRGATLADPFEFSKGCPLLKIPGRAPNLKHSMQTQLWDVEADPGQQQPLNDGALEARMIDHLVRLMKANEAPSEQFVRLGLPE